MTVATIRELNGRHVLFILIAFFGAMLLANGLFLYFAISTFNGMEPDAYQKGIHYNDRIEAAHAQAALGWSHKVVLAPDRSVALSITGRDGKPIPALTVTGEIGRPVADGFTQTLAFRETVAGTYRAGTDQLQPGNWVVSLRASSTSVRSGEAVYQIKERLWLNPAR